DASLYGARENRAIGHQPGFEALPVRIPIEASGGVYSSIADMPRFARLLMHHGVFEGRTLLERALWDEMHTPPFPGVPYALGVLPLPYRYERGAPTLMNHNGGGYGFGSSFTYCPEAGLAWIVMFNGLMQQPGSPAPFDAVALQPALEAAYGAPTPHPLPGAPVVPASREALGPFCGSYVAGQATVTLGWEGDSVAVRTPLDEAPSRLAFTGPLEGYFAEGQLAGLGVRLHPPAGVQPAWMEVQVDEGASLRAYMAGGGVDLNEGEAPGPPGPIGEAYDTRLGDYQIVPWGVPMLTIPLTKRNGYLYFGHMRLAEHAPGLFFSPDGEALDLTGETVMFRNIPLRRVVPA